jgi:hypothetical protein
MVCQPFQLFHCITGKMGMMAAVATSLLPLLVPLCRNMKYHVWYEDSVMEKWKNNNKPMRRKSVVPQSLWHYDPLTLWYKMSQQNIQSLPSSWNDSWLKDAMSDSFLKTFDLHTFHENTSHSHDNLRRVSKSPLLHPFTHHRSGTLDWRVIWATSADSSNLINTLLAHSSTLATSSFNLLSP